MNGWWLAVVLTIVVAQSLSIVLLLQQRRRIRGAKAKLKQSEQLYRQLIETQVDLVFRVKPGLRLTFTNAALCRFLGLPIEQVLGRHLFRFLKKEARQSVEAYIRSVVDGSALYDFELELTTDSGKGVWYHWEVYPVLDETGGVAEIQAIGRDISDRKRAQELDKRLTHAARLAVAGELTAMVAHEVSQPLGAIMANADAAYIQLSKKNPAIDEIKDIIMDIRENDFQASQAIRRIRELLCKHEFDAKPCDLNQALASVLKMIRGDLLKRNIQLVRYLDKSLPLVTMDQIYIQQVLMNLLVNAMDATLDNSEDNRTVVVRTLIVEDDLVVVRIEDNGPGIADAQLYSIFRSFYTTKKDGMGIGLAICRSIIESHGGKIWALNKPEGGALMQFYLPIGAKANATTEERMDQQASFNQQLEVLVEVE